MNKTEKLQRLEALKKLKEEKAGLDALRAVKAVKDFAPLGMIAGGLTLGFLSALFVPGWSAFLGIGLVAGTGMVFGGMAKGAGALIDGAVKQREELVEAKIELLTDGAEKDEEAAELEDEA